MILNSWKEIARHLGLGVRTVQRYERELGLPIRRLAGKPRSSVMAYSEDLDLWIKAKTSIQSRPPAAGSKAKLGDSVLLIEDRVEDIDRARACLQQAGVDDVIVCTATSMALRYLEDALDGSTKLPRGILLDLMLPSENGFEVLRFCHSRPELKGLPVVVWTRLLGQTERQIAHWLGAKKYVTKNTDDESFVTHLRNTFLGQSRVQAS